MTLTRIYPKVTSRVASRAEATHVEILLDFEDGPRTYLASKALKEAVAQLKDELSAQTIEGLKMQVFEQGPTFTLDLYMERNIS